VAGLSRPVMFQSDRAVKPDQPQHDAVTRAQTMLRLAREAFSTLELDAVLHRVLEMAREVTGARYAALGVLGPNGKELERFLTIGIDEETQESIGALPRGHGVLGELIRHPEPLRLDDVGRHARSFGFPLRHPPMQTFLGVPILIGDVVFGNVYLTEKEGAFTAEDEEMVVTLAGWAAVAIENARLHARVSERRDELEQNVAALSAMMDITVALAGETDLEAVQELVAKRSRALVGARAVALLLASDAGLSIASTAGEYRAPASARVAMTASAIADVVRSRRPLRVGDGGQSASRSVGLPDLEATAALVVPLVFRDRLVGVLVAADRMGTQSSFTTRDEHLLHAFGSAASTALATAQATHTAKAR
jgi:GAF domain-containing protein